MAWMALLVICTVAPEQNGWRPSFPAPTNTTAPATSPTYARPPANYAQPGYTQPAYPQPTYAQPTYTQPLPNYTQPLPNYTQPTVCAAHIHTTYVCAAYLCAAYLRAAHVCAAHLHTTELHAGALAAASIAGQQRDADGGQAGRFLVESDAGRAVEYVFFAQSDWRRHVRRYHADAAGGRSRIPADAAGPGRGVAPRVRFDDAARGDRHSAAIDLSGQRGDRSAIGRAAGERYDGDGRIVSAAGGLPRPTVHYAAGHGRGQRDRIARQPAGRANPAARHHGSG